MDIDFDNLELQVSEEISRDDNISLQFIDCNDSESSLFNLFKLWRINNGIC